MPRQKGNCHIRRRGIFGLVHLEQNTKSILKNCTKKFNRSPDFERYCRLKIEYYFFVLPQSSMQPSAVENPLRPDLNASIATIHKLGPTLIPNPASCFIRLLHCQLPIEFFDKTLDFARAQTSATSPKQILSSRRRPETPCLV